MFELRLLENFSMKSWSFHKYECMFTLLDLQKFRDSTRTNLKLTPSQSWGTPKTESFSNWELRKLEQFKGLIIPPYWMLRLQNLFFQFRKFKQWFCSFPIVETLYKLKSSPMKGFSRVNKFGRLKMHTCPKLSYVVSLQNQRKTSEHVTVYTC